MSGRARRIAAVVVGLLVLTGCSTQLSYKEEDGKCIHHEQQRAFGVPTFTQEWPCDKEGK